MAPEDQAWTAEMSLDTENAFDEVPLEVAQRYAKSSPTLLSMIERGRPLTRAVYVLAAWGGALPEPWTWEHEAELPECFQAEDAVPVNRKKRPYTPAPKETPPTREPPVMGSDPKTSTPAPDTLSSPATKTPVANPVINGRVVSPHTTESLRAAGYRVLTPSGKAFVIPTGQRSPQKKK